MTSQKDRAALFRQMHCENLPLVLPNAWDAASARVIELAGARAIATSSAGVSWVYGHRDGESLQREEMIQMVRCIVQAVGVPVTADVESGYGAGSPEDVSETVRAVIAAGAAGVNLEDSPGRDGELLMAPEIHAERIRAARQAALAAGGDLVINARTDPYLLKAGAPETRFGESVRRARIYREAGADCIFVPGVIDAQEIAALVQAIGGPVNVLAFPGVPTIQELGKLGVARVSLGAGVARAALSAAQRLAREVLEQGTYQAMEHSMSSVDVNGMFKA